MSYLFKDKTDKSNKSTERSYIAENWDVYLDEI